MARGAEGEKRGREGEGRPGGARRHEPGPGPGEGPPGRQGPGGTEVEAAELDKKASGAVTLGAGGAGVRRMQSKGRPGDTGRQVSPLRSGRGEGLGPDGTPSGSTSKEPGAAGPRESRAGPWAEGQGASPRPSRNQSGRCVRAQPPRPEAARPGAGGGGGGRSVTPEPKRAGAGTPGADVSDPPPAAPCWKRAASGGTAQPRRARATPPEGCQALFLRGRRTPVAQ